MKKKRHPVRLWAALALATAAALTACGNTKLVDEERTFASDIWNRFTPEVFELKVTDADMYFNVDFTVEVDTVLYRYDDFPMIIDIYDTDGTHRHLTPVLKVRENGRWKGEQRDRYRRVEARLFNYFAFNAPGDYRYEVKQGTSQYDLEGIHSLRLAITEAKLDYSGL
ncbi:MAG: hypothetical protein J6I49_05365 [Bacteroidales bacterium]|nr:hypothetical protein [Bacteroidales bacterium]